VGAGEEEAGDDPAGADTEVVGDGAVAALAGD
jgi:hypothetical protein